MDNIKQFKMTTGDEIICEVIEWSTEDNPDIVVRKALQIVCIDDDTKGVRYYNFKPWMTMQEGDDVFLCINSEHIIAEGNPTAMILKYFLDAVEVNNLSEEDIQERIDSYIEKMKDQLQSAEGDSDSNVILFDRNKLH